MIYKEDTMSSEPDWKRIVGLYEELEKIRKAQWELSLMPFSSLKKSNELLIKTLDTLEQIKTLRGQS